MRQESVDINGDDKYTEADKTVKNPGDPDNPKKVVGLYIGTGKPVPELVIHNDILFVGTTDGEPAVIKVNLEDLQSRLKSWKRQFNLIITDLGDPSLKPPNESAIIKA